MHPGLLTLYATSTCPHCRRAKALLDTKPQVRVRVVELDAHPPGVRRAMSAMANAAVSVPQIFLNEAHLAGGNSRLEALEQAGELDAVLARGLREEPSANVLAMPGCGDSAQQSAAADGAAPVKRSRELGLAGLVHSNDEDLLIRKILRVARQDAGLAESFSKQALCDWLADSARLTTQPLAASTFARLQELGVVVGTGDAFQFSRDQDKFVLNKLFQAAPRSAPVDARELVTALRERTLTLYGRFLLPDGNAVDYKGAKTSAALEEFEMVSCELQRVGVEDLRALSKLELKALFINLYNALVVHGHIVLGHPDGVAARNEFFTRTAYDVGGQIWTLDLIEHGALRANRCKPFALAPLLSSTDSRLALAQDEVDCRLHFALNCGARSCPPIRLYESDALDEQLDLAAQAFCEDDGNVLVSCALRKIVLSKILFWYGSDFHDSDSPNQQQQPQEVGVLKTLRRFLSPEKARELDELMGPVQRGEIKVEWFDYDWAENS